MADTAAMFTTMCLSNCFIASSRELNAFDRLSVCERNRITKNVDEFSRSFFGMVVLLGVQGNHRLDFGVIWIQNFIIPHLCEIALLYFVLLLLCRGFGLSECSLVAFITVALQSPACIY